jgi:hypothetical protein
MRLARFIALCLVALFMVRQLPAQQSKEAPPAPVPEQILSDKRIFIGPSDYTGASSRAYNEFYAAMKSWGHYKLESLPQNAGLLFEIHHTLQTNGHEANYEQLRLVIYERETHALLWSFSEYIDPAITQGGRDKNFEAALSRLVSDLQQLVGGPVPTPAK